MTCSTPFNVVYHCPHPFRWAYCCPSLHTMQQRTIFLYLQEHIDFPVANATIGYLIARPKVQVPKAPKRVCLIYTNLNDTFFWTVDPTSCLRKIKPGVAGMFRFNTTKIGKITNWLGNFSIFFCRKYKKVSDIIEFDGITLFLLNNITVILNFLVNWISNDIQCHSK